MVNFTIISSKSGDWEALYANGKLLVEGHRLYARDVLDSISNIMPNTVKSIEIDDEIAEMGLPIHLSDLPDRRSSKWF